MNDKDKCKLAEKVIEGILGAMVTLGTIATLAWAILGCP